MSLWIPSLWSGPGNSPRAYLRRTRGAAAAFDPTTIAGLKLWLAADTLSLSDGDPVSTWTDGSGSGNDAADDGASPVLYKANIINGLPVVRPQSTSWMDLPLSISSGPKTYVAVINPPATSNGILMDSQTGRLILYPYSGFSAGNVGWFDGSIQDNIAAGVTGFQVLTWRLESAGGAVYRNGVLLGTAAHTQTALGGTTKLFRVYPTSSATLLCDLAEFLIYDTALGTTDREYVEDGLMAKYAL